MASKGRELGNIVSPQTGIAVTVSGDPVVIDVGNIGIGTTNATGKITSATTSDDNIELLRYYAGANGPVIRMSHSYSDTIGGNALIPGSGGGYSLGRIDFRGSLGSGNWGVGGRLKFLAKGSTSASSLPTDCALLLTPSGSTTPSEVLRVSASGSVGIGTDNPGNLLHLQKNGGDAILELQNSGNGNHSGIFFVRESSGGVNKGAANIHVESNTSGSGSALVFGCGSNISSTGSEKARVTSGGDVQIANGNLVFSTSGTGIDFSATSNGTGANQSELLDDYEEGTWTPKFIDMTNGNDYFTNNGLIIYHANYVKIGEHCWASAYIANDASFSYATGINGTQAIGIGGLPFTVIGSNGGFYPISVGYFAAWTGWGAGYTPMGYFYSGYDRVVLTYAAANTVTNILGSALLNAASGLLFSGYYKVA